MLRERLHVNAAHGLLEVAWLGEYDNAKQPYHFPIAFVSQDSPLAMHMRWKGEYLWTPNHVDIAVPYWVLCLAMGIPALLYWRRHKSPAREEPAGTL